MASDANLIKTKDMMEEVIQAMIDLKKPKGVSPKEIINLIADRSNLLSGKKAVATKIKMAIVNGLKSGVIVENNGLLSISKLIEVPGRLNARISLTELRRRRGRRRRGRGRRRRGKRQRSLDADRSKRITEHDVAERISKKIDDGNNCGSPDDDSGSQNRSSVKDLSELRRRRRRRSRGRRRRRHRNDIYDLRRRRARRRRRGRGRRRGQRRQVSDIHELRRRRRRRGRIGRRRRRQSIIGCATK